MLGLGSVQLGWAYILCILATLLCVIYGAVKWNDYGRYIDVDEEELRWRRDERAFRDHLP
jgi:hypothetical protein